MINEAYHTLKEKFRRAQYDREHPSAGKWEGKYGQFAYNNFKRYSKYGQFAYNYFKRYATYILEFVVKGGKMVAIFSIWYTVIFKRKIKCSLKSFKRLYLYKKCIQ